MAATNKFYSRFDQVRPYFIHHFIDLQPIMIKLRSVLLIAVSFLTLGIAAILFEALALYNRTNFHPCPADLICEYWSAPPEFYWGVFPAIAGVVMLGIHRINANRKILDSRR